ncbi:MAG: hypothetical protein FWC43_01475, partial [Planctomycetaceae bacterium]|nr:hypothetical protein [Planctomycetaceae bacterium]
AGWKPAFPGELIGRLEACVPRRTHWQAGSLRSQANSLAGWKPAFPGELIGRLEACVPRKCVPRKCVPRKNATLQSS